jgi:hypothetical protein
MTLWWNFFSLFLFLTSGLTHSDACPCWLRTNNAVTPLLKNKKVSSPKMNEALSMSRKQQSATEGKSEGQQSNDGKPESLLKEELRAVKEISDNTETAYQASLRKPLISQTNSPPTMFNNYMRNVLQHSEDANDDYFIGE